MKLTSGRWYYEVTIGNTQLDCPQFGWCDERFAPRKGGGAVSQGGKSAPSPALRKEISEMK